MCTNFKIILKSTLIGSLDINCLSPIKFPQNLFKIFFLPNTLGSNEAKVIYRYEKNI